MTPGTTKSPLLKSSRLMTSRWISLCLRRSRTAWHRASLARRETRGCSHSRRESVLRVLQARIAACAAYSFAIEACSQIFSPWSHIHAARRSSSRAASSSITAIARACAESPETLTATCQTGGALWRSLNGGLHTRPAPRPSAIDAIVIRPLSRMRKRIDKAVVNRAQALRCRAPALHQASARRCRRHAGPSSLARRLGTKSPESLSRPGTR
jgi:hypothetical protein